MGLKVKRAQAQQKTRDLCAIRWSNFLLTQQLLGQLVVEETTDELEVVWA